MDLNEKSLCILELPSVLKMLASEAVSEPAKERSLSLSPGRGRAETTESLKDTSAAKLMISEKGSPAFTGIKDIRPALVRADLGGVLNTRELLDTAEMYLKEGFDK